MQAGNFVEQFSKHVTHLLILVPGVSAKKTDSRNVCLAKSESQIVGHTSQIPEFDSL